MNESHTHHKTLIAPFRDALYWGDIQAAQRALAVVWHLSLCNLDFWRIEAGRIRENFGLIDLLDVYQQLGIDVLERMRAFNKARVSGAIPFPIGGET